MSLNCFQRLSFLLVLLAITTPALQLNWQGSGNMTQDNMTAIQAAIDNQPIDPAASIGDVDNIAINISTTLNNLWNPAWNVFIVMGPTGNDVIFYGYAFRKHWMWINGVALNGREGQTGSYVIWKDYNCQNWHTIGELTNLLTTFTTQQLNAFLAYTTSGSAADIWANAYNFVQYAQSHASLNSGVYTAVMSQSRTSVFSAYMCLVNRNFMTQPNFASLGDGYVFLFQTRTLPS